MSFYKLHIKLMCCNLFLENREGVFFFLDQFFAAL